MLVRKLACAVVCAIMLGVSFCASIDARLQANPVIKHCPVAPGIIDTLVDPRAKRSPGAVVVGVIDGTGRQVFGWGRVAGKIADGKTVFELASLSKVFSGLLLSELCEQGKVKSNQPVDNAIGQPMPHFGGCPITLGQLATHTSGLPAWPSDRGSTCSAYSSTRLVSYLKRCHLANCPGQTMIYSNAGYALLGDALAHKAGKNDFESLLVDDICNPLQMPDTRVHLTADMKCRLARGHNESGGSQTASSPTAGGGADGVCSTVNDLLQLIWAYTVGESRLSRSALAASYKSYASVDDTTDTGYGWYLDRPTGVVWKTGRLAGYRTFIGFSPVHKTGAVVLAAWDAFPSKDIGQLLMSIMDENARKQ